MEINVKSLSVNATINKIFFIMANFSSSRQSMRTLYNKESGLSPV